MIEHYFVLSVQRRRTGTFGGLTGLTEAAFCSISERR